MTKLWKETPLIYSSQLSKLTDSDVYLKLETCHPSFSFKFRGISHFIQKEREKSGSSSLHLVIASGGNAGLAAACSARALNLKCTIFIPEGAAKSTIDLLKSEEAEVFVGGQHYFEAWEKAVELVAKDPYAVMVPAYDHPALWEGHASMVHEIKNQLQREPDAIFCSVGGGGLLGGIMEGCENVGWDRVPLIAVETIGTDCFYHSLSLNQGRFNNDKKQLPPDVDLVFNEKHNVYLAHFNKFSSMASGSLGASEPSAEIVKKALLREGGVQSISIPDELSMAALLSFVDDHKILVELACSTTLVPAYNPELFNKLVVDKQEKGTHRRLAVFIICGGFKIDLQMAREYKVTVYKHPKESWPVECDDGQPFNVETPYKRCTSV